MANVETSIIVAKDIDTVYNFTKNMEQFPEYMPDVKSVKVVKREGNKTVTEWAAEVDGAPINWKEQDTFDDHNKCIGYKLIEGDFDKFEGEWTFTQAEEGTLVKLTVTYDLGITGLDEIINPILKEKVKQNSQMMLSAIKTKMEST